MEDQQNPVKSKLNVHNLVTFILLFIAMILFGILSGFIPFDIVGIMVSLAFVSFLALIGFWIEWSGLAKYLGWDRG